MADDDDGNNYATLKDFEEPRTMLKTPENLSPDKLPLDYSDLGFHNSDSQCESVTKTPLLTESNDCDQSTDSSDDTTFDHNEWQIEDPHSRKNRPPRQNEFLRLLLDNPRYSSYATWLDPAQGTFLILKPEPVAALWGKVKGRQTHGEMNYGTFARGVRYYYKKGIFIKTHRKYTFRFNLSKQ